MSDKKNSTLDAVAKIMNDAKARGAEKGATEMEKKLTSAQLLSVGLSKTIETLVSAQAVMSTIKTVLDAAEKQYREDPSPVNKVQLERALSSHKNSLDSFPAMAFFGDLLCSGISVDVLAGGMCEILDKIEAVKGECGCDSCKASSKDTKEAETKADGAAVQSLDGLPADMPEELRDVIKSLMKGDNIEGVTVFKIQK